MQKIILYIALLMSVGSCSMKSTDPHSGAESLILKIYAAAGTRAVTEELCTLYTEQTGIKVECNYASSGILARQIVSGAEADVFISANSQWIDFLLEKDVIAVSSVETLAANTLVMIVPFQSELVTPEFNPDFDIASTVKHSVVIGDPSYVPVGKYTKAFLDTLHWFERIEDKMVLAKDVSSVLRYVEMNECDWGVVYRSEAISSDKVRILTEVPDHLHDEIVFFIARLSDAGPNADSLIASFTGGEGRSVFLKQGFSDIRSGYDKR